MWADPKRWSFAAILLLAGANLVIDPDNLARLEQNVITALRDFDQMIRSGPWARRNFIDVPPPSRTGVRLAGLGLIAAGLLVVAVS